MHEGVLRRRARQQIAAAVRRADRLGAVGVGVQKEERAALARPDAAARGALLLQSADDVVAAAAWIEEPRRQRIAQHRLPGVARLRDTKPNTREPDYCVEEARRDFAHIVNVHKKHGWTSHPMFKNS